MFKKKEFVLIQDYYKLIPYQKKENNIVKFLKLVLVVLLISNTVISAERESSTGLALKVGTLGAGADFTVRVFDFMNLRLGATYTPFEHNFVYKDHESDIDMMAQADLNIFSILGDVHPFGGGFRVTAGPIFNNNDFSGDFRAGTIVLHKEPFDITSGTAGVDFDELCWYFGLGYGNAVGSNGNWHFAFDIGVMYQGSMDITASADAVDPDAQSVLDRALESEIKHFEDHYAWLQFYPVISIGVSYKF